MPRFFFHIRDGDRLLIDEDGLEFDDVAGARAAAVQGASDMLKDAKLAGQDIRHQIIEICDPSGKLLGTVSAAEVAGGRA